MAGVRIMLVSMLVMLSGCSITEDSISTSASNYVRLSEYRGGYPLLGGIAGCQLSGEGEVAGNWSLKTENCEASSE